MKVIITGDTGRIGGGALQSALSNPAINEVVVLSRCETAEELAQLEGVEACIWALGAPTSSAEIHVQYPLAAQRVFAASLAPETPSGKPFHFVLLSGGIIVRDQGIRLPPGMSGLKQRGQVEQDFVDFEARNQKIWRSFVARPWMVVMPGSWLSWAIPHGLPDSC